MTRVVNNGYSPILVSTFLATLTVGNRASSRVTNYTSNVHNGTLGVSLPFRALSVINANNSGSLDFGVSAATTFILTTTNIGVTGRNGETTSSNDNTTSYLRTLNMGVGTSVSIVGGSVRRSGVNFLFTRGCRDTVHFINPIHGRVKVEAIFGVLNPLAGPTTTGVVILNIFDRRCIRGITGTLIGLNIRGTLIICNHSAVSRVDTYNRASITRIHNRGVGCCAVAPRRFNFGHYRGSSLLNNAPTRGTRVTGGILSNNNASTRGATILLGTNTNVFTTRGNGVALSRNVGGTRRTVTSNGTVGTLSRFIEVAGR